MIRKTLILYICLLITNQILAQTVDQIKNDPDTYLWGEGSGPSLKNADQDALSMLISQIYTQVESSFSSLKESLKAASKAESFTTTCRSVLNTYSSTTLKNTERIIVQDEPDARVFRYVRRSEISRIFESRRNKIIELARNGESALESVQIADAIRYFYWSQTLLRSHPDQSEIRMENRSGDEVLLITWLPKMIKQIFTDLDLAVDSIEDKGTYVNYLLKIKYKGIPARNFDYTYWSGRDWSNIISAKDGIGVVEFPKPESGSDLKIKAEYFFEGEANMDMELRDVMQKLPQVPYPNSLITISRSVRSKQPLRVQKAETIQTARYGSIQPIADKELYNSVMGKIVSAISSKSYSNVVSLFTSEGYSVFQKLLQYGNAVILKNTELKYFQYGDFVICRSIPMSFNFKSNDRTFIEDMVFYFDKENKICNITFSLSLKSIEDITGNDSWSPQDRLLLICFLENYKTAFALKRYDYISSIFSDDALIITGWVTRVAATNDSNYRNTEIIRYNRLTKADYLKKLKYSFDSNEFINIRFTDNNIRRSGKGENIFGIQIRQDYFSTTYGDTGYLFLLVDLSDSLKPQIHVRTWQPEKNPDGSIYGLSDF